jgi:hypothetical protein
MPLYGLVGVKAFTLITQPLNPPSLTMTYKCLGISWGACGRYLAYCNSASSSIRSGGQVVVLSYLDLPYRRRLQVLDPETMRSLSASLPLP